MLLLKTTDKLPILVGFLNIPLPGLPGYLGEKILDYPGSQKSSNLETLISTFETTLFSKEN